MGTAIFEILIGLLIMRIGKAALDKVLPPIVTGSVAMVIGIALAGTALDMAGANWGVAFVTLLATILFSVYLRDKGLWGMLPILLGAIAGYAFAAILGIVDYSVIANETWLRWPHITHLVMGAPGNWSSVFP